MSNYIIRRLIQAFFVLIILSYLCFSILSLMPGDPVDVMITSNPKITKEDITRLKKLYGLDKPNYVRYFNWLTSALSGDLGYSRVYKIKVEKLLGERLINTFILSVCSLVMAVTIGIAIGVYAGMKKGSKFDYIVNFISYGLISMPSFWLAIVLIMIFSIWIPILPAGGTRTVGDNSIVGLTSILDRIRYLILPALSLASLQLGIFVRYARSAMIEALGNDYIRTAKAKGLGPSRILWNHAFRNALIPLITVVTLSLSGIFSGAIITETVFSYQGVGKLVYDSIIGNDFNVAMVSFMISVAMILTMNLLADILYGVVDPRISYK
ncbi:MAG: ABC transporter permease [Bacteriovoracaceae bacterium]|nr:ABC transporter permease [Bacteriovoracaceae bacterium]